MLEPTAPSQRGTDYCIALLEADTTSHYRALIILLVLVDHNNMDRQRFRDSILDFIHEIFESTFSDRRQDLSVDGKTE